VNHSGASAALQFAASAVPASIPANWIGIVNLETVQFALFDVLSEILPQCHAQSFTGFDPHRHDPHSR
jgi:hypothetical protein